MWKEFEFGDQCNNVMYLIDTNVLVDMCKLYYRGQCTKKEETDDLKQFILRARKEGIQNQFSLIESSFDWRINQIDSCRMQKLMMAYDALVMYMSEEEIEHHIGVLEPYIKQPDLENEIVYKSVFDCQLPKMLFDDWEMRYLFYTVYVLCLKIRLIYNDKKTTPFIKVKEIYNFMINDLNLFLDKEFFLATQLFIGKDEEQTIARDILKPDKQLNVRMLVNAAMDIFQYRMVCFIIETMKCELKIPAKIIFVTGDVGLQKYIERIGTKGIISSQNMITPCDGVCFDVQNKHEEMWNKYYKEHILPEIKMRAALLHMQKITDDDRKKKYIKIRKIIETLEKNYNM